jgi:hypothetical protein
MSNNMSSILQELDKWSAIAISLIAALYRKIEAQNQLLVAYRMGTPVTERTWKLLEGADCDISKYEEQIAKLAKDGKA